MDQSYSNIDNVISRYLAKLLRHKPQEIGLQLDNKGWAYVDELLDKLRMTNIILDKELLDALVEKASKKRFIYNEDKSKIRAIEGHSIKIEIDLQPAPPPKYLYHGTARHNLSSIRRSGILRGRRLFVHLAQDHHTALTRGKIYGNPVVLLVKALEMYNRGYKFYMTLNGNWLVERVEKEFIDLLERQKSKY